MPCCRHTSLTQAHDRHNTPIVRHLDPIFCMQAPHTTPSPASSPPSPRRWHVDEIDYAGIDLARIQDQEDLFYLVASASFIETGSDMYTRNLVRHYADYPEVAHWLQQHWEPEELQHGLALRRYVEAVWPEFPWQEAFDAFFAEYGALCTDEELERDRTLELVARCVVETGTTTYYHTMRDLAAEPVLADLANRIRGDEVQHYKYFLQYFRKLQASQPAGPSRLHIARVLYQRLREIKDSDSDVALRHVWQHRPERFRQASFAQISQRSYRLVSSNLPITQVIRMLLKPVDLPRSLEKLLEPALQRLARRVLSA